MIVIERKTVFASSDSPLGAVVLERRNGILFLTVGDECVHFTLSKGEGEVLLRELKHLIEGE